MKKIANIILMFIVLIAGNTFGKTYADGEYIKGFKKSLTYSNGMFSDIDGEWCADAIISTYEFGLMKGVNDNIFNPNGYMTNAEAVAIASRIHSIYNTAGNSFTQSSPWYKPYMDYAVAHNICDNNFNPNDIAQRSFFIGILGNAIDLSSFTVKNKIDNDSLWDVHGWYSNSVYQMYRAGILCGNDQYGTFSPDSSITRGEVAAIIVRLIEPSSRKDVSVVEKTYCTISAPLDGNSLENFRQRAFVANLKWLLNNEPQGKEWQNDIYKIEHSAIPGDYIHVYSRDIERKYDDDIIFIYVPKRYFNESGDAYKLAGSWTLSTGFNSYVSGYSGSMPDGKYGDLYLSKPAVAGYTTTITYSDYTEQVKKLIDSEWQDPTDKDIDDEIKSFISLNASELKTYTYQFGKIDFRRKSYYIQLQNTEDVDIDTDNNPEYITWCNSNFNNDILVVLRGNGRPYMLTEFKLLNGYDAKEKKFRIRGWEYNGWNGSNQLSIKWRNKIELSNPIKISNDIPTNSGSDSKSSEISKTIEETKEDNIKRNNSNKRNNDSENHKTSTTKTENDKTATNAEKEIENLVKNGYAKICKDSTYNAYHLDGHDDIEFGFAKTEIIEGYDYALHRDYKTIIFAFNLNSKKAIIRFKYNGYEYGEQVLTIPEPKKIDNEFYLPVDEVLEALEADGEGWERIRF